MEVNNANVTLKNETFTLVAVNLIVTPAVATATLIPTPTNHLAVMTIAIRIPILILINQVAVMKALQVNLLLAKRHLHAANLHQVRQHHHAANHLQVR